MFIVYYIIFLIVVFRVFELTIEVQRFFRFSNNMRPLKNTQFIKKHFI